MKNHILVIDDDKEVLDLFNTILTDAGYLVTTLTEVANILVAIEGCAPDLVIIDYLLPGINGGEMCAQIKREEATLHIPVILMSAHSRVFLSLGTYNCDEFLEKPFDINYFNERISYHMNKVKQRI